MELPGSILAIRAYAIVQYILPCQCYLLLHDTLNCGHAGLSAKDYMERCFRSTSQGFVNLELLDRRLLESIHNKQYPDVLPSHQAFHARVLDLGDIEYVPRQEPLH